MKSILVIGLGRFGYHLAHKFSELGNDVMIADIDEELVERLSSEFDDARICDCTDENVVKSLGVSNFDYCFVAIGSNFQATLEVTALLKEFGAKCVISKANSLRHASLLKKIGADDIVYPERDVAEKTAIRLNAKNIFDFIELTSNYAIYEIPVPKDWIGKTVGEVDVRKKYEVNIIAVKRDTVLDTQLTADYMFVSGEHLVVIGKSDNVFRLAAKE